MTADRAIVQLAPGAAMPIRILSVAMSQGFTTTVSAAGIYLARLTAAQTVTAAVAGDLKKVDPADAATSLQLGTALTGFTGTTAGTVGDSLFDEGWQTNAPFYYQPIPEEMENIPGGGLVALMWSIAPPAGTYRFRVKYQEGW